ncbi:MAG: AAA family ATPase [bacterium]|nr:AAA family ATPase [bacterium]
MYIQKISLENYRIFIKKELTFKSGVNLVLGNNSTGKTSLLEAIFFAFSGELINSFNPINYNSNLAKISISFLFNEILNEINLILKKKDEKFDKNLFLNEKKIDTFKEVRNRFLSPFLMNTFDISLISLEPENKRDFIDRFLKISDQEYRNLYYNLKRILKQKTNLLKRKLFDDIINSLNHKIVEYSSEISYKRINILNSILEDLNIACRKMWKNIEEIKIIFTPGFSTPIEIKKDQKIKETLKKSYSEAIQKFRNQEIDKEKVIISSNRDNFEFILIYNNRFQLVKNVFSQSQVNIFSLIFFLSLVKKIKQIYNYYPVILLDEPFVFLDTSNTEKILKILHNYPQVIITSNKDIESINNRIYL